MSIFTELRRRNVFRIGAVYAIVAWIIVQVTDLVVPALRLPTWVPSLVVFLLLIGLPIALLLAWAYEITPEGIKKTKDIPLGQSISRLGGRKLDFVVIGLLAGAVLLLVIDRSRLDVAHESTDSKTSPIQISEPSTPVSPTKLSIAVLPFTNMSEDPNQEHFADGLAEELLNSLAAIGDLRVISRTSSFAFKERNVSIAEIAAALQVDHILEGSVRRAGDTVRVTAQLIDTSSDSHIWSNTYDRELNLNNILDIQDEIAVKVVNALNLRLLPQESALLTVDGPANLRALDLFHDGMFYLRKIETGQSMSRTTFETAIKNFEAAIAADPDWAPAHAKLGRVFHFGHDTLDESDMAGTMRTSKRYVMEAIRLDEDYGPAYESLGFILAVTGDYDGAMREFYRARALNVDVSWGNAILMLGLGRYDEAIDEYQNAVNHDPLSMLVRRQLADAYLCSGRYADAIEAIEGEGDLFDNDSISAGRRMWLSESYIRAGDEDRGLQIAIGVEEEIGENLYVALLFALAGEIERARSILNSQEITGTDALLHATQVLAALGDEDQALTMLERGAASAWSESQPLWMLWYVQCSPEIRRLAGNPRYDSLLNQLGLPD